ncbi:MAG TPA: hypothetical protein VGC57_11485 [Cellulomonas sp.]
MPTAHAARRPRTGVPRAAPAGRTPADRALDALLALPDRLPVLVVCLGVAGVLAVLVGQFRPVVVLPLALVGVVATWRLVPTAPPRTLAHLGALAAVLALCAGWLVIGLRYVSGYVVVNRDPGFLTLRGLWLSEHTTGTIPVGSAQAAAAAASSAAGASAGTEAFWLHDGVLHVQGNAMLPSLLGMQGWLGGERAVLAGDLVIGVLALLAVFAAARAFAGPLWALVPTAALALSLPFLVMTRAAYTEPLTVVFLCGGLALLRGAWRRDVGAGRHALVGALTGAVAAARIDGAVVVVGLALGYALVAVSPLGRADRSATVRRALAAIGGAVVMLVLGMVDVLRLSPEYVRIHTSQLTQLLTATALVVVVAVAVVLAPSWVLGAARRWVHARRRPLGVAAAVLVLVVGVVLASRPRWWVGRFTDPASGVGYAVEVLQYTAGLPLDAARSYDEQSLTWVSWYLGWPAVVLGFAGLAVLAWRAVRHRDPARTVLVAVVAVAAVFPLVRVSITPDQIWAVRRLVPATFPGLLVAGACGLAALAGGAGGSGRSARSGRREHAGRGVVPVLRRVAAAGAGVLVALAPWTHWNGVAGVVELSGRDTQAHAVCDALTATGAEKVVWVHSSPFRYLATLRVMCDVEVVEVLTPPTAADLAAIRDAWGGGTVAAASFDVSDLPWSQAPTDSVGGTLSTTLGRTLTGPPTTVDSTWSEVWIGLVQGDGTVLPVG